jgi:hypothetical protein
MKSFRGQNPQPGTAISYVLAAPVAGDVRVAVADAQGTSVREMNGTNKAGLNRVRFDPRATPPAGRGARPVPAVAPGTYTVTLSAGGRAYTTKVVVEADRLGR